LEGVWARGTSKKNWDPLHISATVIASNFKFGIVTKAPGRAVATGREVRESGQE